MTAEWSPSSLFSLRFKEVAQVFEVFNHMPLLFRCIGSSSTISITGEMGNDEWTVITLQLTDAFRSPSLFVFNGGLWRNGCSAAFMSGAGKFLSLGSKMGAFLAQFIATKHCHNNFFNKRESQRQTDRYREGEKERERGEREKRQGGMGEKVKRDFEISE